MLLLKPLHQQHENGRLKYGTFDFLNFKPQGLTAADVPNGTYAEMLAEYPSAIDNAINQRYLNGLIKSGSTVPVKWILIQEMNFIK